MAKVKETKLDAFRPQEHNHNTHSQRGMGALEASMRKHGYVSPMTAAADGEILDGSARLETVANVFGDDVMVVEHDGKRPIVMVRTDIPNATTNEARAISIAANRVAEINLTWNAAELLADMQSGIDMAGLFDQSELDALLAGLVPKAPVIDPGGDVSKADELQAKWQVALGDIWQLGKHRLACGDCTDKATVERLMAGEKADMVFTDPPYGVDYAGGRNPDSNTPREKLQGDKTGDLYLPSLKLLRDICSNHAPMYIWFASTVGKPVYDAVDAIGYTVRAMIVWNKLDAHYGNFMAQYMQKHEPCLYIVNGSPDWSGPTNEVTVWDVKQPTVNEFHPTQKPIELAHRAIGNHKANIVADFFAGSGTTLIACEQLGRQARCIEISPAYCSVILERWSVATNTPPVRLTGAAT